MSEMPELTPEKRERRRRAFQARFGPQSVARYRRGGRLIELRRLPSGRVHRRPVSPDESEAQQ